MDQALARQAHTLGRCTSTVMYPEPPSRRGVPGSLPTTWPPGDWFHSGKNPGAPWQLAEAPAPASRTGEELQGKRGVIVAGASRIPRKAGRGGRAGRAARLVAAGGPAEPDPASDGRNLVHADPPCKTATSTELACAEEVLLQFGARLISKRLG